MKPETEITMHNDTTIDSGAPATGSSSIQTIPSSMLIGRIFEGHMLRFAITGAGDVYIAKDACESFGIKAYRDAIARVPSWGLGCRLRVDAPGGPGKGGSQTFATLNRHGIYWLAMRSNTEQAARFQAWLCTIVLPAIDTQGFYAREGLDPRLARVTEGRHLLVRAQLLRGEAAEVARQARQLLALEDGATVAELLPGASPEQKAAAVRLARAYARRNNVPVGRTAAGRMALPRAELVRALGLDQSTLTLDPA